MNNSDKFREWGTELAQPQGMNDPQGLNGNTNQVSLPQNSSGEPFWLRRLREYEKYIFTASTIIAALAALAANLTNVWTATPVIRILLVLLVVFLFFHVMRSWTRKQPLTREGKSVVFIGIAAYSPQERDRFFGRDIMISQMVQHISREDYIVGALRGYSGVGKTSLIRAGLIPELESRGFFIHVVSRYEAETATLNGLKKHRKLLIVFDQFEQFLSARDTGGLDTTLEALFETAIASSGKKVKLLFVIREDFFGAFDEVFFPKATGQFTAHKFILKTFTKAQAISVIAQSLNFHNVDWERGLIDLVAQDLLVPRKIRTFSDQAGDREVVWPAELQILCEQMQIRHIHTIASYKEAGRKARIVYDHLLDIICGSGEADALSILLRLIGADKVTRERPLSLAQIQERGRQVRDARNIPENLAVHRIVNIEGGAGAERYELAHEYLIPRLLSIGGGSKEAALRADVLMHHHISLGKRIGFRDVVFVRNHISRQLTKPERMLLRKSIIFALLSSPLLYLGILSGLYLGYIYGQQHFRGTVKIQSVPPSLLTAEIYIADQLPDQGIGQLVKAEVQLNNGDFSIRTHGGDHFIYFKDKNQRLLYLAQLPNTIWPKTTVLSIDLKEQSPYVYGPSNADEVWIPPGSFLRGGRLYAAERPMRVIWIDGFFIRKTEVSNAEYQKFLNACSENHRTICPREFEGELKDHTPRYWNNKTFNNPDYPVVGVDWHDATAYCRWLSLETGLHYRLPTEAEWEKAASWDWEAGVKREYAWGDLFDASKVNMTYDQGSDIYEFSAPVTSLREGATPSGLLHMTGNVWEWCLDAYGENYYSISPSANPLNDAYKDNNSRIIRGGSYLNDKYFLRCAFRDYLDADYKFYHQGFRVVRGSNIDCR